MRVRHLSASSVVVEGDDTRVLCDPWLADGAFYGAWAHYPPLQFDPEDYADVDYIYVSHIHPDHCHGETLAQLDDDVPVLIHDYQTDFLGRNIEAHGFEVQELSHDERTHLGGDLHLNIMAADDCDPEACGSYFGCAWWMESQGAGGAQGSTQIDSMGVFDDGEHVLVNANDCRWPMSAGVCERVRRGYGDIDMLLMQYGAANFYPQCMGDLSSQEKLLEKSRVAIEMLDDAASFIEVLEPDYYMPFAAGYVLAGSNADYNPYVAVSDKIDACGYLAECDAVPDDAEPVLLNSEAIFDIETGRQSEPYAPVDERQKRSYIENVLAERTYTFEDDPMPSVAEFEEMLPRAYEHFEDKRRDIGFETETDVFLRLPDRQFGQISFQGEGVEVVDQAAYEDAERYVRMDIDPRLLSRILQGPKHAHFNNAQIGSHIDFYKEPDVYERPLYYAMSFFHTPVGA